MRKKFRLISIFILVLSLFLSACGSEMPDKKVEAGVTDASDVTILEKPRSDGIEIKHVFNKGVTFKVDKAHANTIDFIFGKKDQTIKLEDGNGLVWTLELPPDALLYDVHISMTAITDIVSGDLGSFNGGVLFEPDGLQFSVPAKLTVTGKNIDKKCVLLSGDNEGKALDFINLIANEKGAGTELAHFSTVYAAPSSSNSKMAMPAKESLDEAYAAAKAILKQPIDLPAPPVISLKCNHSGKDDGSSKIMDKYAKQFMQPEQDIIAKIMSAQAALSKIDSNVEIDWSVMKRLGYRLVKKSVKLIKTYSPQPDYLMASSNVSISVDRSYSLVSRGEESGILPLLAQWARKVTDKFLEELINNHDYEKIHPILKLGNVTNLLSSGQSDDYLKLLSDALQFRIEYENIVNIESENPMGFSTEGRIPINLGVEGVNPDVTPNRGSGIGKYTGFISPDPKVGLVRPNTYNINCQVINFLPCQYDNFDILIDMFGAKKEVMTAEGRTVSVDGIVQRMGIGAFHDKLATNPLPQSGTKTVFFKFNLDVHNMNEIAGEKTFEADVGGNKVEFTLKLVHTPNGKGPSKSKDSGEKDPFAGKSPDKGDNAKEPDGGNGSDGSDGSEGDNGSGDGSTGGSEETGGDGDYKEADGKGSQNGNGGLPVSLSELPEDFPKELVPIPDDAKIMAGSGDASSGWMVVYTTAAKPSAAADFVKEYMKTAENYMENDLGTGVSITGVKNDLQIAVMIIDDGGVTMVSISVGKS